MVSASGLSKEHKNERPEDRQAQDGYYPETAFADSVETGICLTDRRVYSGAGIISSFSFRTEKDLPGHYLRSYEDQCGYA